MENNILCRPFKKMKKETQSFFVTLTQLKCLISQGNMVMIVSVGDNGSPAIHPQLLLLIVYYSQLLSVILKTALWRNMLSICNQKTMGTWETASEAGTFLLGDLRLNTTEPCQWN